ncbi:MAG TPA: prepilin-type N-terminal cleavage/methylation domain-containing protein [Longimicrobiales bacterium]|nr:prepilin-type N-terminal cleavage/methylation domain-containing protein [Longimicrobiales bacterium]
MSRPLGRAGFTLIEVLTVSLLLGALAGIATPQLSRAIDRAGAAKVVADAHNLTLATRAFMAAGGTLPASSEWGVAPTGLSAYLEETMPFAFRDVEYRFVTQPDIGVAQLWVGYEAESGVGEALQRFRRPGEVTWTPTRTTFVLVK